MVKAFLFTTLDMHHFHLHLFLPIHLPQKQLLYVPEIIKNLLSVSKFANDNHVSFEFHPISCFVKDLATRVVLLQGQLKVGLYVFDNIQRRLKEWIFDTSYHIHLWLSQAFCTFFLILTAQIEKKFLNFRYPKPFSLKIIKKE